MKKQEQNRLLLILASSLKRLSKPLAVIGLVCFCFAFYIFESPATVSATTPNEVNFQARLEQSSGAIVPDGNYNVTFHIYDNGNYSTATTGSTDTSCSSDTYCLWEESYTYSSTQVPVSNGYLTVSLGSINSLPSNIWNQQLWLSIDIGGTTSSGPITWDSQMNPLLQLTAVPYAFSLDSSNSTTGYSSTLSLIQPANGVTGNENFQIDDQGGSGGTYTVCIQGAATSVGGCAASTGGSGYIQNQSASAQSASFWINGTGEAATQLLTPTLDSISGALSIGTNTATGVTIGNTTNTSSISLVGESTATISIGTTGTTANATTVHIADTTGNAAQLVTIGSTASSSALTLQAGTGNLALTTGTSSGNITLTTNNASSAIKLVATTASTTAIQLGSNTLNDLTVDTSNNRIDVGTNGTPISQLYVSGSVPASTTASLSTGTGARPQSVYVEGNYAYVVNNSTSTLEIIDVSTPSSPAIIGTVPTTNAPWAVYVQGEYAYVINQGTANNLQIFNISNPAAPFSVSTTSTGSSSNPWSVYVSGQYAYVVNNGTSTLQIYNVSNPANPVQAASVTTGTGSGPESVFVAGNYAYVANNNTAILEVFNISNPSTPISIDTVSTGTRPQSLYVSGRYVYVVDGSANELQIFDVSNPYIIPAAVGTFGTGSTNPYYVFVQGRYAYIANYTGNTLQTIDVSNPSSLASVGIVTASAPDSIFVSGLYAYVTNYTDSTLKIFNLGGEYAQQLQTGGLVTGTLQVNGDSSLNGDTSIQGGLVVSSTIQAAGNSSLGALTINGIGTPGAPTETVTGSTGTSYSYAVAALNNSGSSPASTPTSASGASTLNTTNYIETAWSAVPSAIGYNVYRTASSGTPSSTGLIGTVSNTATSLTPTSGSETGTVLTLNFSTPPPWVVGQGIALSGFTMSSGSVNGTRPILTVSSTSITVSIAGGVTSTISAEGTAQGALAFFDSGSSAGTAAPSTNSAGSLVADGSALFEDASNSTTAFQIQNSSGANLLQLDTSSNNIYLGGTISSTTIDIGSVGSAAFANTVAINTSSGAIETTTIGSTDSTSTLTLQGGVNSTNDTIYLTDAAAGYIGIGSTTAVNNINIGSIGSNANADTVAINTSSGAIETTTIGSTDSTSTLTLQGGVNSTADTIYLKSAASGYIGIGSTTAVNNINIGSIGSNANTDTVAINTSSGAIETTTIGSTDSTSTLTLQGGVNSTNDTIYLTDAAAGYIGIGSTTAVNNINIGSIGSNANADTVAINTSSGAIETTTIGSTDSTSTLTLQGGVNSTNDTIYLTDAAAGYIGIGSTTAVNNINIGSIGSNANADTVAINTSSGAIETTTIGSTDSTSTLTLQGGVNSTNDTIYLTDAAAGYIGIGSTTAVNNINIGSIGSNANADTVAINTSSGAIETTTIGSTDSTSTLTLQGGVNSTNDTIYLTDAAAGYIGIGSTTAVNNINIGSIGSNANADTVAINTSSGAIETTTIGSTDSTSTLTLQGGVNSTNDTIYLTDAAAGYIGIGSTTAVNNINIGSIGSNANADTVAINTSSGAIETTTIGSTDSTSTLTLQGGVNSTADTIYLKSAASGYIGIGSTTAVNNINIGSIGSNANADTVAINTSSGAIETTTIGSTDSTSTLTLQGNGITNTIGTSNQNDVIQSTTNNTVAFELQNSSGSNLVLGDTQNGTITLANTSQTAGSTGTWTNDTASPLSQTLENATSVTYNGYIYELGGNNGSTNQSTVYYAPINTNGSIGAWTNDTASPLSQTLEYATSVVYNGYIYELGGLNSTMQSTVYYAPINTNGSIGAWNPTTSLDNGSISLGEATSVVYNGYVYELGGNNGSTIQSAVYYAPINANGTLGTWSTTTPLDNGSITLRSATSVVYNGYVYELGGYNGIYQSAVYYAPINANGTLGTWINDTASPLSQALYQATSVVYNGYVYELGGYNGIYQSAVYYAPINANGTLGTWINDTANPLSQALYQATSVVYNGYVYELGGSNGSVAQSTTYYALLFNGTVDYLSTNANGTVIQGTASSTALQVQNAQGQNLIQADTYNGAVTISNGTDAGGTIGNTWTNSPNSLPTVRYSATSVIYNGYIYELGGYNGTSVQTTVYYAQINSNGTIGTWNTTTALDNGSVSLDSATSVAYNGYIYELGGTTNNTYTGAQTIVYYAPINANGTVGAWSTTTSLDNGSVSLDSATSVAYNGYIYELGGVNSSGVLVYTVYYAPINTNGTIGSWAATTNIYSNTALDVATSVAYNGYIYELGGWNGSANSSAVYYAPINTNGTIGTWANDTASPLSQTLAAATSIVYNGYIYEIGGNTGSANVSTVYYAQINSNGTIGTWITTTALSQTLNLATSVVYNGNVYELGGYNGSSAQSTVYYTDLYDGSQNTITDNNFGVTVGNSVNSSSAFQVQNSNGTNILNANTSSGNVTIGALGSSAASSITLDPSSINGGSARYSAEGNNLETLSVTTHTLGNLLILHLYSSVTNNTVTSVTGGGVSTWNQVLNRQTANGTITIYEGVITGTGVSTITANYGTSPATSELTTTEYTDAFPANTNWSVVSSNSITNASSTTVTFPSLTSTTAGELYDGYAVTPSFPWTGGGSPASFTFLNTAFTDAVAYNGSLAANTTYNNVTGTQGSAAASIASALIVSATYANINPNQALGVNGSEDITGTDSATALEVQNASGSVVMDVNTVNDNVGIGTTAPAASLQVNASSSSTTAELIQAAASQSADLLDIDNSSSTVIDSVNSGGVLYIGSTSATEQSSSSATGIYIGATSSTDPRIQLVDDVNSNWEIDNNAGTFRIYQPSNIAVSVTTTGANKSNLLINGHIEAQSTAPSCSLNSAWGSGGSLGCTVAGADTAGLITITAGSSGVAVNAQATITFSFAFNNAPYCVFTPADNNATTLTWRNNGATTAHFLLASASAPTINDVYGWYYICIDGN